MFRQTPSLYCGETDTASGGALDSAFKGASVNGAVYNYFYDAFNRRRVKVYPLGNTDEYFYDRGHQLLVDRGNDSASVPPTFYPDDNYVWLGGRPVVVIRGKMNVNYGRLADSVGDCTRNGDAAACGLYFPVTDHIGKPILMLGAQRRVVGTGEYDVFGTVNRVQLHKDTVHPYLNNSSVTVADFTQPRGAPSVTVSMRVLLHQVDVQDAASDFATVYDGDPPAPALDGPYRGYHQGQLRTNWVTPSAGHLKVSFVSGAQRCCPNGLGGVDCTCPQNPNFPYTGIVIEGYQYRRYQTGAQPFWTPLGFPGQYFDSETDLLENWNRYLDPATGRYLQPEPLIAGHPQYIVQMARMGHAVQGYSYALNSPLTFIDRDGFRPQPGGWQDAGGSRDPWPSSNDPEAGGSAGGDESQGGTLIQSPSPPGKKCDDYKPPLTKFECHNACAKANHYNLETVCGWMHGTTPSVAQLPCIAGFIKMSLTCHRNCDKVGGVEGFP